MEDGGIRCIGPRWVLCSCGRKNPSDGVRDRSFGRAIGPTSGTQIVYAVRAVVRHVALLQWEVPCCPRVAWAVENMRVQLELTTLARIELI